MNQKELLSLAAIAILLLIGLSFVGVYYAQDFDEDLQIIDSISYEDLDVQTHYNSYREETEISSISANIGTLSLENKGQFSKVYKFPKFQGCIFIEPEKLNEYGGGRIYSNFDVKYQRGSGFNEGDETIDVGGGESLTFDVVAEKTSGGSLSIYTDNVIEEIALYDIEEKPLNPLIDIFDNRRRYERFQCYAQGNTEPSYSIVWVE